MMTNTCRLSVVVWFRDVLNNSGVTDEQKIVNIHLGYECGGI